MAIFRRTIVITVFWLSSLVILEKLLYSEGAWYFYMLHSLITRLKRWILHLGVLIIVTQIPVKSKNFVVAYNWNTVSPYYIFDINPGFYMWLLHPGVSSPFCMWFWQKKIPFSHTFYWKKIDTPLLFFHTSNRPVFMNKSLKRKPCHFHVVIQPWGVSVQIIWNALLNN